MNISGQKKTIVCIVLFLLLLFTRIFGIIFKTGITHDEVISFISVTGNQEAYHHVVKNKKHPYGNIVPVAEWKKLWTPGCTLCFKKIQSDLMDYDLHPPFYFWLLHLFILIFGVHMWTGLVLNLVIEIMTAIILYRFAFQVLKSKEKAWISIILWGFFPSTIDTFMSIRQYSLFVFFSLLLIYSVSIFITNEKNKIIHCVVPGMTICMGLLTFYYFVFVVFGCGIWILLQCRKNKKIKIVISLIILFCSLLLFFSIHPGFIKHLGKISQIQKENMGIKDLFYRLGIMLIFFCPHRFFIGIRSKTPIILPISLFALVLLITLISIIIIKRKQLFVYFNKLENNKKYIIFILSWLFLYNAFLYLGFFSPEHAMTGRYLSIINPLLVIILVLFFNKKKIFNMIYIITITAGILSVSAESVYGSYLRGFTYDYYKKNTQLIILDNVKRGYLPRYLWYVPGQIYIIAATEEDLIKSLPEWQKYITSHTLFLSNSTNSLYNHLLNSTDLKPEPLDIKLFFSLKVYGFSNSNLLSR